MFKTITPIFDNTETLLGEVYGMENVENFNLAECWQGMLEKANVTGEDKLAVAFVSERLNVKGEPQFRMKQVIFWNADRGMYAEEIVEIAGSLLGEFWTYSFSPDRPFKQISGSLSRKAKDAVHVWVDYMHTDGKFDTRIPEKHFANFLAMFPCKIVGYTE